VVARVCTHVRPGELCTQSVETGVELGVAQLAAGHNEVGVVGHKHLWVDVLQVPLEGLALVLLADVLHVRKVAQAHSLGQRRHDSLDNVLELVHPDFGRAQLIADNDFTRHLVDLTLPVAVGTEHVADVRTGDALQRVAALPNTEGNLHLLTAVKLHLRIIAAQVKEELAINGEEAASH
jgi:hypothetical protein